MIIAFSGRKQHGKDTAASLLMELTSGSLEPFVTPDGNTVNHWERKSFAGLLKAACALLLGVDVSQFDTEERKNERLPQEFAYRHLNWTPESELKIYAANEGITLEQFLEKYKDGFEEYGESIYPGQRMFRSKTLDAPPITYREFLQRFGTEVGRNIHQNFWIISLMKDYKRKVHTTYHENGDRYVTTVYNPVLNVGQEMYYPYPDWSITDCRFPNEVSAVEKRGGIVIRVIDPRKPIPENEHVSEKALDDHEFTYMLVNDGTIDDLREKLRVIINTISNKNREKTNR